MYVQISEVEGGLRSFNNSVKGFIVDYILVPFTLDSYSRYLEKRVFYGDTTTISETRGISGLVEYTGRGVGVMYCCKSLPCIVYLFCI